MASIITKGLGSPQQLITEGYGPEGFAPPVQIIRGRGGNTARTPHGEFELERRRRKDDDDKFIERWIIQISGEDIYNRIEKEIDTRKYVNVKVADIESSVDENAGQIFTIEVNQLRINSE